MVSMTYCANEVLDAGSWEPWDCTQMLLELIKHTEQLMCIFVFMVNAHLWQ